ncbi:MAG: transcription-repair coupling factor, partial [Veillonella sp.]|nr:transcription-repair coupling factor [Veillonella sp.]
YIAEPDSLRRRVITIALEQEVDRDTVLEELVANGYERVDQVEQRGHFAVRGDIIDVFPVNEEKPVRIELFGDEVDTIRHFDEVSQRSIDSLDAFSIAPFRMVDSDALATLFSYGQEALLIIDEPLRVQEAIKKYLKEDPEHAKSHADWSALTRTMVSPKQIAYTFMQQRSMGLSGFTSIGIQGKSMTSFERQVPIFVDEVKNWHTLGHQVVLVMNNQQRKEALLGALAEGGVPYAFSDSWDLTEGTVLVMQGLLTDGFELPHSHLIVVTEGNIYGTQKKKLRRKQEKGKEINYFTDLAIGDYVVHSTHGIGKYIGLKTIEVEGNHKDYIEIAYAGTDRLFLPANHLDQLQKYIGNEGDVPRIHKMGGSDWRKVKAKAQKSID